MEQMNVSKATLGRLPQYLQYLKSLPSDKQKNISATIIAKELSLGEVQVRKDLASVSGAGKPKIGYVICDLIKKIEISLGYDKITNAVLVGAGKLGRALLEYNGFEEYGVRIVAAFDCDKNKLSGEGAPKKTISIENLKSFCAENEIQIGIITVDKDSAQDICEQMIESGIKAIWNFAPCRLSVPGGILLKQENLALSLAYLNNQLNK